MVEVESGLWMDRGTVKALDSEGGYQQKMVLIGAEVNSY